MLRIATVLFISSLLITPSWAASTYQVQGVAANDTLNMRQSASAASAIVTKLPADATQITRTGNTQTKGSTVWAEVNYQGKKGWVNQRYLAASSDSKSTAKTTASKADSTSKDSKTTLSKAESATKASQDSTSLKTSTPIKSSPVPRASGSWILECGNTGPYWKAEILPKSVNLYQADYESGLPITFKRQVHGKWNQLAAKTEVVAERGSERVSLTMRYSPQCYSKLAKKTVSFKVTGKMNGEEISGCCRSYQVP